MKVIGLVGWSGAGKTTLVAKLIPALRLRGLTVSTVKHAHHGFDIDQPGKDSHVHREAGAREVLVASARRWALIHELADEPEPSLGDLIAHLAPVDIVLAEGFKRGPHAKIEVHRVGNAKPFLFPEDPSIVGVASDAPPLFCPAPSVHLDDVEAVASLVIERAMTCDEIIQRLAASPS